VKLFGKRRVLVGSKAPMRLLEKASNAHVFRKETVVNRPARVGGIFVA